MSAQGPYDQMAKEFMAMWQKQWASVMSDKQFIHAMLGALQNMQQGYYGTAASTPYSNAAASSDDDERVAKLSARLTACEKRITELESALAAKPKPASRRSAGARTATRKPAKRGSKPRK